jgi:hypothetical protein
MFVAVNSLAATVILLPLVHLFRSIRRKNKAALPEHRQDSVWE